MTKKIKKKYFFGNFKEFGNFLFYGILNPDTGKRFSPRKALAIFNKDLLENSRTSID